MGRWVRDGGGYSLFSCLSCYVIHHAPPGTRSIFLTGLIADCHLCRPHLPKVAEQRVFFDSTLLTPRIAGSSSIPEYCYRIRPTVPCLKRSQRPAREGGVPPSPPLPPQPSQSFTVITTSLVNNIPVLCRLHAISR